MVGRIALVRGGVSKAQLITDRSSLFTARSVSYSDGRESSGVARGEGVFLSYGNVLLSEVLKPGDVILTKGDISEEGTGFPPNLIVGKIVSIDKKPSDLFQKAKVESPIDFSDLDQVFIIIN